MAGGGVSQGNVGNRRTGHGEQLLPTWPIGQTPPIE
jgi:hypothetical protein